MVRSENRKLVTDTDGNFGAIDLFKIISAIIVIAIHTNPFSSIASGMTGRVIRLIYEFPVPFFFIASGFFLQKKISECMDHKEINACIIKNAKNLIIMYLLWEFIYMPFTLYGMQLNGNTSILYKIRSYVHSLLFIGKFYYSHHLWYMIAAIWAVVLLGLFYAWKISKKQQWILSIILFLSGVIFSTDNPIKDLPILSICRSFYTKIFGLGGVVYSLLYYQIGMLTYRWYKSDDNKPKRKYLIVSFLIGIGGIWLGTECKNLFIPLYVMPLFWMIIELPAMRWKGLFYVRKISGCMYFSHLLFMWVGERIVGALYKGSMPEIPLFLVTATMSFLFGILCLELSNVWRRLKNRKEYKLI